MTQCNGNDEHSGVLIVVGKTKPELDGSTFQLLSAGKEMANELGAQLRAVVFGKGRMDVSQALASFVHEVFLLEGENFDELVTQDVVFALEKLCGDQNPYAVLLGGTLDDLDLASRLGWSLGVDVMTDCVRIRVDTEPGNILCTKPVYNGTILATFRLKTRPCVIAMRPKVVDCPDGNSTVGRIIHFDAGKCDSIVGVKLVEKISEESADITEAEVIVGAGRIGLRSCRGIIHSVMSFTVGILRLRSAVRGAVRRCALR